MQEEIRDEACEYLGRELTDAEWNEAFQRAERKLEYIIGNEGDADGERRKPYYIGQLVAEAVRESAFSRLTMQLFDLSRFEGSVLNETVQANA